MCEHDCFVNPVRRAKADAYTNVGVRATQDAKAAKRKISESSGRFLAEQKKYLALLQQNLNDEPDFTSAEYLVVVIQDTMHNKSR
jgi:hypothetical protein